MTRRRLEIARGLVHISKDSVPRRADHWPRPGFTHQCLGDDQQGSEAVQPDDIADDSLRGWADRLCHRIAIVDDGKLAALDTPTQLKDNIPGNDVVEAEFANARTQLARDAEGFAPGRQRK